MLEMIKLYKKIMDETATSEDFKRFCEYLNYCTFAGKPADEILSEIRKVCKEESEDKE